MDSEETLMKLDFQNPEDLQFSVDSYHKINYMNTKTNECYNDVDIRLMFPLTSRNRFIAVYYEGEEIAIIKDFRKLSHNNRKIIGDAIEKRYFIPVIIKINKIVHEYRMVHWYVETNKGELDFFTRTRNDVVVKEKQVYIKDIDGNRYLIRDHTALSAQSQRELNPEI